MGSHQQQMLAAQMLQQQMMGQPMQQWSAQPQQQQWGMGGMNQMGMGNMQNLQNMQNMAGLMGNPYGNMPGLGMGGIANMSNMGMGSMNHAGGGGAGGGNSGPSDPAKEGPPGCNLFVYHTPPSWGDNEIAAAFAPYGKIVSATIMKNKATGLSKGFGFVSFDNTTSANNAIAGMAGFEVDGKRLKVEIKKAKSEANFGILGGGGGGGGSSEKQHGPAGCNLFVYHCPAGWDDEAIKQTFSPYGAIVSATIIKDKSTGASKRFGFVNFDNPITAQQAQQGMNGHEVDEKEGNRLKVQLTLRLERRWETVPPCHGLKEMATTEMTSEGYPVRPGQGDCSFYMKTGQCKFGATCKWNHPHKGVSGLPDASRVSKRYGFVMPS